MPPALEKAWHTHGYYGSVSHNVKAVYQRYMGWFDGNPARLWPHPPEALGHPLRRRRSAAWTASSKSPRRPSTTATSVGRQHCSTTRSSPTRTTPAPAQLYADTLEQLAYGAENATWRNFFLSGATELRDGQLRHRRPRPRRRRCWLSSPRSRCSTRFAISVNGPRAWDLDLAIDVTFLDVGTNYRLTLRNGVLVYRKVPADEATANATVKLANKLRLLASRPATTIRPAGDHR